MSAAFWFHISSDFCRSASWLGLWLGSDEIWLIDCEMVDGIGTAAAIIWRAIQSYCSCQYNMPLNMEDVLNLTKKIYNFIYFVIYSILCHDCEFCKHAQTLFFLTLWVLNLLNCLNFQLSVRMIHTAFDQGKLCTFLTVLTLNIK